MATHRNSSILFVASATALIGSHASAGELFLLGLVPYSYAYGASADGSIVVGSDMGSCWYWTRDTWVVRIEGSLAFGNGVGGNAAVTNDGSTILCPTLVANIDGLEKAEAVTWDRATNTFDTSVGSLGYHCDISRSSGWSMNGDASYVCGLVWDVGCAGKGFIYERATDSFTLLPTLYFFKPTRGNDVSDDGSVVCGWNDDYVGYRQGCVWKRNAQGQYVGTLLNTGVASQKLREASCVSGNGQWVYGEGSSLTNGAPYRWSYATGYQPITGGASGNGYVNWANYNGSVLLVNFGSGCFVWISGRGYVPIRDYAAEKGVTYGEEWALSGMGMTEDGLTITGYAIRSTDGGWSPFVLDLRQPPQPCTADLNGDSIVDAADLADLLTQWGGGPKSSADLNGDGLVDAADLASALAQWGPCQTP